jgi:hypothetical protein
MNIQLKQDIQIQLGIAKQIIDKQGRLMPVIDVTVDSTKPDGKQEHIIMMLAFDFPKDISDYMGKRMMLAKAGLELLKKGYTPLSAIMTTEAWYIEQKTDKVTVMPSQSPDRKEAIIIIAQDKDQTYTTSLVAEITRDIDNKITVTKERWADDTGIPQENILSYLFEPNLIKTLMSNKKPTN